MGLLPGIRATVDPLRIYPTSAERRVCIPIKLFDPRLTESKGPYSTADFIPAYRLPKLRLFLPVAGRVSEPVIQPALLLSSCERHERSDIRNQHPTIWHHQLRRQRHRRFPYDPDWILRAIYVAWISHLSDW